MSKIAFNALYFAEDKDIFDLLVRKSGGFTTKMLTQVARERGLFVSSSDQRDELAEQLSKLSWDWTQLQGLLATADRGERPERTATLELATKREQLSEDMTTALDALKRETRPGDQLSYTLSGTKYKVTYQSSEMDHTKTRLEQRKIRTTSIEIDTVAGQGYRIRHDANEKADVVLEQLFKHLNRDAPTEKRRIELSGISDPKARTAFFLELMTKAGADLADKDVSDIDVTCFAPSATDAEDPAEMDESLVGSEDAVETEEQAEEQRRAQSSRMLAVVESVLLRGKRLLDAPSYTSLLDDGFFVRRAQWRVLARSVKNVIAEFEAEFSNGKEGTGFRFDVKGVYRSNRKSDGFKKAREHATHDERQSLLTDLEVAAQGALSSVSSGTSEFLQNLEGLVAESKGDPET